MCWGHVLSTGDPGSWWGWPGTVPLSAGLGILGGLAGSRWVCWVRYCPVLLHVAAAEPTWAGEQGVTGPAGWEGWETLEMGKGFWGSHPDPNRLVTCREPQ